MRTWRPGPLDERGRASDLRSGGRNRTPNYRTRTCRVADYTTPEWVTARRPRGRRNGDDILATGRHTFSTESRTRRLQTGPRRFPAEHGDRAEDRQALAAAFDR